jgi:diguanylate cyclase
VSWNAVIGWFPNLSTPMTLLLVATIAYFFGRRQVRPANAEGLRARREFRRAQAVARELETISELIGKQVAKHQASLSRFKQRLDRLAEGNQDAAARELFREAEEILQPTIQFAGQIAQAYDQIRQQTNRLMTFSDARVDPLTGVSNRRALDDTLGHQMALKNRYGVTFSVVIFDIDHFKHVNDREGHLYGDRVLQDVAQILDEGARETDTVVRYGGEEFVIVMPETDLEGASYFADRIRAKIQEKLPVTISGGVTTALDGDSAASLLARADAALYDAKTSGRNCVHRHDGETLESVVDHEIAQAV